MRYMPTLRLPVFGSRVITQGRVTKRPPSLGQHCRMGKSRSEKLSWWITSLHGPVATVLGKNLPDRKSTRLNSSHANISYAVFCLKKKIEKKITARERQQRRVAYALAARHHGS